jgi:hypothetical protein
MPPAKKATKKATKKAAKKATKKSASSSGKAMKDLRRLVGKLVTAVFPDGTPAG